MNAEVYGRRLTMKIHKHIWKPVEKKRLHSPHIHQCTVCGKIKGFKRTQFPEGVHNYLWCPKCGFELVHQATNVSSVKEHGIEVYKYECPRCKEVSKFTFDVAPVAVQIAN